MLVDVDWVSVSMTDVSVVNKWFNLRWQLKYTSGWIEAPGEPSVVCIFLEIPGYPCDLPMDRHPGLKGS